MLLTCQLETSWQLPAAPDVPVHTLMYSERIGSNNSNNSSPALAGAQPARVLTDKDDDQAADDKVQNGWPATNSGRAQQQHTDLIHVGIGI